MRRTLIVTGGSIEPQFALSYIKKKEYSIVIGVDKGLEFLYDNDITPGYVIGDFDSVRPGIVDYYKSKQEIVIKAYNPVKDAADTQMAIELAIECGSTRIDILGAIGTRMDHVLGNIACLMIPLEDQIPCYIINEFNKICLINRSTQIFKKRQFGTFVSLISYTQKVIGLTLEGFKYPLKNYTLQGNNSLGISNEIVEDIGTITFEKGIIVMIQSKD